MNSNSNSSIEKCSCDETESDTSANDSPQSKDKKSTKLSLSSLGLNLRRGRSMHFARRTKKTQEPSTSETPSSSVAVLNSAIKKFPKWGLKLNCVKKVSKSFLNATNQNCCKCTCYKKTDEGDVACGQDGAVNGDVAEIEGVNDANEVVEEDAAVGGEEIEEVAQAKENDGEEQEEANVGIYGTNFLSLPPAILNGQFLDVHW